MGSGVGLFIGFIGLKSGGIIVSNNATLLGLGDFSSYETFLSALGFLLISVLAVRKVPGAIIIGVLGVTLAALLLNLIEFQGVLAYPPSLAPTLMKLDILGAFDIAMISVIMSFLFVNLFDTTGTLLGVASRAGLVDKDGNVSNLDKALKVDSSASILGTFFGCSPVTSYVESSAGVEAGGRTGLTAIIVGVFFLIAIFFSPLASMVPGYASAGALIYVAILMLGGMEKLDWSDNQKVMANVIESSILKGIFGTDVNRRNFLKAVGASTASAAIASVFPIQQAIAAIVDAKGPLEKTKLNVGFVPITCATPIIMGQPMGFYQKYGLDVDVIKTAGWAVSRDKSLSGEYDAAHMLTPMPLAITVGAGSSATPWTMPAVENINGQAIVLAMKHKDKMDPKKWKGFTFGVPFELSLIHI